jgi:hypothetical protein
MPEIFDSESNQSIRKKPEEKESIKESPAEEAKKPASKKKKLEIGKTVIAEVSGKVNGRYTPIKILYGNLCDSYIEGEIKQLREDIYDKYLQDFLNSEDGQDYETPTREEMLKAKLDIKNQVLDYQEREKARKVEAEAQARRRAEDEARLAALYGKEPDTEDDEEPEAEPVTEPVFEDAQPEQVFEDDPEEPEEPKKRKSLFRKGKKEEPEPEIEQEPEPVISRQPVAERPSYQPQIPEGAVVVDEQALSGMKRMLLVLTVLSVLSILATAGMALFGKQIGGSSLTNASTGELNINGETYTVPLSTIEVGEGESKTVFYALTTTNQKGKVETEAYPIGEWIINQSGAVVQPAK